MTELWNDVGGTFQTACGPDYLSVEKLRELQLQRLKSIVARAYEKVEMYAKRMDEKSVKPDDIKHLSDIAKLPFTVKTDLRDTYPFGLFASPMNEVVRPGWTPDKRR